MMPVEKTRLCHLWTFLSAPELSNHTLISSLCMICPFDPREKQALLESKTVEDRADMLLAFAQSPENQIGSPAISTLNEVSPGLWEFSGDILL